MPRLLIPCLLTVALAAALAAGPARAEETAHQAYEQGLAFQKQRLTLQAIAAYRRALALDPHLAAAHYELGWSYWVLGEWSQVVQQWEEAQRLHVDEPLLVTYLGQARDRLNGKGPPLERVPMHTRAASPAPAAPSTGAAQAAVGSASQRWTLELVARFQQYDPQPGDPADHYDPAVFSPKSVIFTPDGIKAYVNALEGGETVVYDARTGAKLKVIPHRFGAEQAGLFAPADRAAYGRALAASGRTHPNWFTGKPVEFALTHGGRYLWISYYRRDYDREGLLPSAVAIVDTRTDEIVRVMDCGPIPKFLAASPDGHWLAIIHWGDNTVEFIDISGADPAAFRLAGLVVVERRLPLDLSQPVDRDHYCGFCLRGSVFTADSRYLLVGRMGGGGIALIDVPRQAYLGTVYGMPPTPRHLVLSPDGQWLYVSSNVAGEVSLYRTEDLVRAVLQHQGSLAPLREVSTGSGTRTIALAPQGRTLFAAVNRESKLVMLDAQTLRPLLDIAVDSYPVGLAVAPDGGQVWVTSQGVKLQGGNSVSVYRVERTP
ncbi:MAG TPA: beta-propeller fold lactonase family protein [bacterium]|nr:beta-propeller fold lactonase family protein [bacterium]